MPDHGYGKISERDLNFSNDGGGVDQLGPKAAGRAIYAFDFAVDGGAVGSIQLRGDPLPVNAVVVNGLFVPTVTPRTTGNTGTFAFQLNAANDLLSTTAALDGTIYDEVNPLIPILGTISTYVQLTAARVPVMVVATNAITAGRFFLVLDYFVIDAAIQTT